MDGIEELAAFFQKQDAKAAAERSVMANILKTMMARQAAHSQNPEEYIMTLTAGAISGFDEVAPEDELGALAYDHGAAFCNDLEIRALSRLHGDP